MSLLAPLGAIVRVWFPETESVLQPGPKFRPCLVLGIDSSSTSPTRVLVAYGTSQHTERHGLGEFVVKKTTVPQLDCDTKFCLTKALWLPLSGAYFASGGRQLQPVALPKSLYSELYEASREAKLN